MGFRCGFLGLLHMEVFKQRLFTEFEFSLGFRLGNNILQHHSPHMSRARGAHASRASPPPFPLLSTRSKPQNPKPQTRTPNSRVAAKGRLFHCNSNNHVPSPLLFPQVHSSMMPALHSHTHAASNFIPWSRHGKRISLPLPHPLYILTSICISSKAVTALQ